MKKKRVVSQFEDLQQCYLRLRGPQGQATAQLPSAAEVPTSSSTAAEPHLQHLQQQQQLSTRGDMRVPKRQRGASVSGLAGEGSLDPASQGPRVQGALDPSVSQGLTEFSRILSVFTHCSRLRVRPSRA